MLDFNYHNPTRIIFGRGVVDKIGIETKKYGSKALLVMGQTSLKESGLYHFILEEMEQHGITIYELEGIMPNPRIDSVREGVELCKNHAIQIVIAAGGGSVVDAAKAIAVGAKYDGDPWDFYTHNATVTNALPIGVLLTLAATGSDMNGNSVITNWETKQKLALAGCPYIFPKFSILDPNTTYSVCKKQTAYGSVDIMAHVFEQYFSKTKGVEIQNGLSETLLRTIIKYTPKVLNEPTNYTARANLMWANTMALNGLIGLGKVVDWATHNIEHEVSAIYDIAHGAGLAIIFPSWMRYVMDEDLTMFEKYAINVWDIDPSGLNQQEVAEAGINATEDFFKSIGVPTKFSDVSIDETHLETMAKKAIQHAQGPLGGFKLLREKDIYTILKGAL